MFPLLSTTGLAILSNGFGAAAFAGLALFLVFVRKSSRAMRLLQLACAINAGWLAAVAAQLGMPIAHSIGPGLLETLRTAAWLLLAFCLIPAVPTGRSRRVIAGLTVALPAALGLLLTVLLLATPAPGLATMLHTQVLPFGAILMALWGLVLSEQVLRGSDLEGRWALKYAILGLGVLFGYDFFMYTSAFLYGHVSAELWSARGIVNALAVPLLAVSVARHETWYSRFQPSRQTLFRTGAIGLGGGYLLFVGLGGYAIRVVGTNWAEITTIVFVIAAIVGALVLLFSGKVRGHMRVFVDKHFFRHKYDYRTEWLALTRDLSESSGPWDVYQRAIRAVARLLDSPGGALWVLREGDYVCVSNWNLVQAADTALSADAQIVQFLRDTGWIMDLDEHQQNPQHYRHVHLPELLTTLPRRRLLVPLYCEDALLGILLLAAPRAHYRLTWEDHDLLKMVGRQVGGFLDQQESAQALAQARQFEGFNRLTAYLMHDLKNIANQQWLMLQNAQKHKHNPVFVDDMVATIADSVERMKKLLGQLRGTAVSTGSARRIAVDTSLAGIVAELRGSLPAPSFAGGCPDRFVRADPEAFANAIKHLIRNAQEATPADGRVAVESHYRGTTLSIAIIDSGRGMTQAFIRDSLFQPFITTKTAQGLGIGAHQARDFARAAGGDVAVTSQPGAGTTFTLHLPIADVTTRNDADAVLRIGANKI